MSSRIASRSTKSDAEAVATAVAAGVDPLTLVTGDTQPAATSSGKKSGKKKKKKMTKAEKALAKLEKQCDDLRKSGAVFDEFLIRLDRWLKTNYKRYAEIFSKVDIDGEGYVTFEEFKAVVRDLMMPCSTVELHTVCQLLDPEESEEINYQELGQGLERVRDREASYTEKDVRPGLIETNRQLAHCGHCNLAVWDGEPYKPDIPRYIEILFRLVTFEGYKSHPGHFTRVVRSDITVLGLLDLIQSETGALSNQLALFTDKTREPDAMLVPERSLEDQGFHGGRVDEPAELLLYYDYKVEYTDCPVLLCDHYFGNKIRS